jgi:hypothetical protein
MVCSPTCSRSNTVGVPLAPIRELDAEEACLRLATCPPYMTSRRATRARFVSWDDVSRGSCVCMSVRRTDRIRGPCNRPSVFSLRRCQPPPSNVGDCDFLQGSSSARFSKYLLPYLSTPIKAPAFVSPVPGQHPNSASSEVIIRTDVL